MGIPKFRDPNCLKTVLCYPGRNQKKNPNHRQFWRLAYSGDVSCKQALTQLLLQRYPQASLEELDRQRQELESDKAWTELAILINLPQAMKPYLSKQSRQQLEDNIKQFDQAKITQIHALSDTFEAMMAAYAQDSGFEAVVGYFADLGWLDCASV